MTKMIIGNWTTEQTSKDWKLDVVNERKNKQFESVGDHLSQTRVEQTFARYVSTGDYFSPKGHLETLGKDLGYMAAFFPYKAVNLVTNVAFGIGKTVIGTKDILSKGLQAYSPAKNHFVQAAFDAVCLTPVAGLAGLYYYASSIPTLVIPVVANGTFTGATTMINNGLSYIPALTATNFLILGAVAAVGYALYNPLKVQVKVKKLEDRTSPVRLTDDQVKGLGTIQKASHFFQGSYSLSRAFDLDCKGNKDAKVEGDLPRFALVEAKKEEKKEEHGKQKAE